jgi:hypothetical protein
VEEPEALARVTESAQQLREPNPQMHQNLKYGQMEDPPQGREQTVEEVEEVEEVKKVEKTESRYADDG